MQAIDIRLVDTFPEPAFTRLQALVFTAVQQYSDEWDAIVRDETALAAVPQALPPMLRIGAYEGDELVGWTYGWMERGHQFYMANSGVLPSHQRRGIYTALLGAIRERALADGARVIRSQHSVVNNAVIIAKLQAGFHVSGLTQSTRLGTLVELTLHLSEQREQLFRRRVLPFVASGS